MTPPNKRHALTSDPTHTEEAKSSMKDWTAGAVLDAIMENSGNQPPMVEVVTTAGEATSGNNKQTQLRDMYLAGFKAATWARQQQNLPANYENAAKQQDTVPKILPPIPNIRAPRTSVLNTGAPRISRKSPTLCKVPRYYPLSEHSTRRVKLEECSFNDLLSRLWHGLRVMNIQARYYNRPVSSVRRHMKCEQKCDYDITLTTFLTLSLCRHLPL